MVLWVSNIMNIKRYMETDFLFNKKEKIELFLVHLIIILSTDAIIPMLVRFFGGADISYGSLITQMTWIVLYFSIFILSFNQINNYFHLMKKNKYYLILIFLILFSMFWSASFILTFRRCIALMGTIYVGIYLSDRYMIKDVVKILSVSFTIIIIFSLMSLFIITDYAMHNNYWDHYYGSWRGVFVNKNHLGRIMSLSILCWFFLLGCKKNKLIYMLGFILSFILLIKSNSITGFLGFISIIIVSFVYRLIKIRFNIKINNLKFNFTSFLPIVSFIIILLNACYFFFEDIIILLGRDSTLSNRTLIWFSCLQMILKAPFLGYGYGAFWMGYQGPSGDMLKYYNSILEWVVPHAHNGLIDIALQLGIVGVLLFLLVLLNTLNNLIKCSYFLKENELFFIIGFLSLFVTLNFSESVALEQNNIFWILFTMISFKLINLKRILI